jgi:hypothetical protein
VIPSFFPRFETPWKSCSLMLSSTTCDSFWMSDTVGISYGV